MSKDRKRRQKDLERRLKQRSPGERERSGPDVDATVSAALADPARFGEALRAFSARALMSPELATFRFPRRPFVDAFLDVTPAGDDDAARRRSVRQAILPRFTSRPVLDQLLQPLRKSLRDAEAQEDVLGLFAALTLAGACAQAGAPAEHIFWELVFDLTLTDALLSGDLVTEVAMRALAPDEAAIAAAASAFSRGLAQGEAGRELDALGVDEKDPATLAAQWTEATNDRDGYHVQFDATLHLLDAQTELSLGEVGGALLSTGLTADARSTIVSACAAAYDADMVESTADELGRWARARLGGLRDDPTPAGVPADVLAREKARCAVLLLSLRTLPREQNAFLRSIHARGLVRARRFAVELEVPFVHRISAAPDDPFALEDYERLLSELGELARARRVRRFGDAMRKRPRKQTVSEAGATS